VSLAAAHATASRVEEQIWVVVPGVAEVIVHTEP
jgi:divalent metal cation (Fe/Co/Zn/Cd) transporter